MFMGVGFLREFPQGNNKTFPQTTHNTQSPHKTNARKHQLTGAYGVYNYSRLKLAANNIIGITAPTLG